MSEGPIENTIQPVEHFVNTTLKEELRSVINAKLQVDELYREYDQLQKELTRQLEQGESLPATSLVDLGANFFTQATTQNKERLHLMLSYGYIVEMTREEAVSFCKAKLELLKKRSQFLSARTETIQNHIKQLLLGVAELRMTAELGLLDEY